MPKGSGVPSTDRDAIKKAEAAGYSRGYNAGVRRKKRDNERRIEEAKRKAFAERVFIAVLPYALECRNGTIGETKVTTTEQRMDLAMRWVKRALRERYSL